MLSQLLSWQLLNWPWLLPPHSSALACEIKTCVYTTCRQGFICRRNPLMQQLPQAHKKIAYAMQATT